MKATIIGLMGQELTEKLKKKIETIIQTAINEYGVTDFYFGNTEDLEGDAEIEENPTLKQLMSNSREVLDFIAAKIIDAKKGTNVSSTIIVARVGDQNFNKDLYDEVIQGYNIYYNEVDSSESLEAYDLRDKFIAENIDLVFWYSNKILANTVLLVKSAQYHNKQIIF